MGEPYGTVERVARHSYGRLLAFLSARSRDVAAAEDALAEAFKAVLVHWAAGGVLEKPEAWLLVTARRKLIDQARHRRHGEEVAATMLALSDEAYDLANHLREFPDERLKSAPCCHQCGADRRTLAGAGIPAQTCRIGVDVATCDVVKRTAADHRVIQHRIEPALRLLQLLSHERHQAQARSHRLTLFRRTGAQKVMSVVFDSATLAALKAALAA